MGVNRLLPRVRKRIWPLLLALAVAALVWLLRSASRPQSTPAAHDAAHDSAAAERAPVSEPASLPRHHANEPGPTPEAALTTTSGRANDSAASAAPTLAPEPVGSDVGTIIPLAQVSDVVSASLQQVADPCFVDLGNRFADKRILLRYDVRVADGDAYIDDITIIDNDLHNDQQPTDAPEEVIAAELEQCVVERLVSARWPADGDDVWLRLQQTAIALER